MAQRCQDIAALFQSLSARIPNPPSALGQQTSLHLTLAPVDFKTVPDQKKIRENTLYYFKNFLR